MSRLIFLGSAKHLTQAPMMGPYFEGVDPSDRWA